MLVNFPKGITPDVSSDWGLFSLMNAANNYSQNPLLSANIGPTINLSANVVIKNGLILFNGAASTPITAVLPSAILLIQSMMGPGNIPLDGTYSEPLRIINTTGQLITVTGGVGVTLNGQATIPDGTYRDWMLTPMSATTITVQNVGAGNVGAAGSFTDINLSGNLNFTGLSERITGDFSNVTEPMRVLFQTSTVNGATSIGAIPNGTGTVSAFRAYSTNDAANSSVMQIAVIGASGVRLQSTLTGTGTLLPLIFFMGATEAMRISTGARLLIGTTADDGSTMVQIAGDVTASNLNLTGVINFTTGGNRIIGDMSNVTHVNRLLFVTNVANSQTSIGVIPTGTSTSSALNLYNTSTADTVGGSFFQFFSLSTEASLRASGVALPMTFYTGAAERLRFLTNGHVLINATADTAGAEQLQVNGSLSVSSAVLIRSYTALTNNAAGQIATITNGPTVGNPTKWIPINDNGTIRNIPAW